MKKTVAKILAAVLALAVVVSGVGAAAAQEDSDGEQSHERVLGVRLPSVVKANESVTISVIDRGDGSPVPAASVYALTWPYPGATETAAFLYGCEFLGKTDNAGEVVHAFERPGRGLIVATKEGWGPGLARLCVKPNVMGRLAVEAPRRVKVNEPATIEVLEKGTGAGVKGADVWAVGVPGLNGTAELRGRDHAEGLLDNLRLGAGGNVTRLLESRGMHLGQTNSEGQLEHSFGEMGRYLLVATKSRYVPGCRVISVVPAQALALDIDPGRPEVGEEVRFTVTDRETGDPIAGVDMYGVGSPLSGLPGMSLGLMDGNSSSLEGLVSERGFNIGTTNENGQCEYTFDEAGGFLIVGIKDECSPALGFVRVGGWEGLDQLLPRVGHLGEESRRVDTVLGPGQWRFLGLREGLVPMSNALGVGGQHPEADR
jgi:hypothetical protein